LAVTSGPFLLISHPFHICCRIGFCASISIIYHQHVMSTKWHREPPKWFQIPLSLLVTKPDVDTCPTVSFIATTTSFNHRASPLCDGHREPSIYHAIIWTTLLLCCTCTFSKL
jgi:hypothetical protein